MEKLEGKTGDKSVTTDQIKSISQAISVEKIADMKAKFMARKRKTIQEVDESSDFRMSVVYNLRVMWLNVIFPHLHIICF